MPSRSNSTASSVTNSPAKRRPGSSTNSPIPPARRGSLRSAQSSPKSSLDKSRPTAAERTVVTGLPPPKPPRIYASSGDGACTQSDVSEAKPVEEMTVSADIHPLPTAATGILTRSRSKSVSNPASSSKPPPVPIAAKSGSFDTVDYPTASHSPETGAERATRTTAGDRMSLSLTDELELKFREMQSRFRLPEPHFGTSSQSSNAPQGQTKMSSDIGDETDSTKLR